jgi:hypothetical protein
MRKVTKLWTCRDGRKVRICDMADSHLVNTIRMLRRKAAKVCNAELQAAYSISCLLQGEMASWECDLAIESMESDPSGEKFLPPIYDDLCDEADRRGLNFE